MNTKNTLKQAGKATEYAGASLIPSYAVATVLVHFYPHLADIELEIAILVAYLAHLTYSLVKYIVKNRKG